MQSVSAALPKCDVHADDQLVDGHLAITTAVARARATFQQAASLARQLQSAERLARAALDYGGEFRGFDLGVVDPALILGTVDKCEEGCLGEIDSPYRSAPVPLR